MKRNGITVTPKELIGMGNECLLGVPESEKDKLMNQSFEMPIVNPTGFADDWKFEEPAS